MNEIELWTIEGSIYPILDSNYMRGETEWNKDFNLGENQRLSIYLKSKNETPLSLQDSFNTKIMSFSMDFRSGDSNWFRVDNQGSHGHLHMHLQSGIQPFDCRIPIQENTTISGIISSVFEKAEEIIGWKFPDFKINRGKDFIGTA